MAQKKLKSEANASWDEGRKVHLDDDGDGDDDDREDDGGDGDGDNGDDIAGGDDDGGDDVQQVQVGVR